MKKLYFVFVSIVLLSSFNLMATNTWIGSGSGNGLKWSLGANWSSGVAPISTDDVVFTSAHNHACSIDASVGNIDVNSITISSSYTSTISRSGTHTITVEGGGFSQVAGTFNLTGGGAFTCNGTFSMSGGTFESSPSGSTYVGAFLMTGGTYVGTTDPGSVETFESSFTLNGSAVRYTANAGSGTGSITNFQGDVSLTSFHGGGVDFGADTTEFSTNSLAINNSMTIDFCANFNSTGSGQTFTIASGSIITVGTASTFGELYFSGNGPLTINTGEIDPSYDIFLNNTGTTGGGTGLVNLNGQIADGTIYGAHVINQSQLPAFEIDNNGFNVFLTDTVSIAGTFTYNSGTVDAITNASTVCMNGNTVNSSGMSFYNFQANSGSVTLGDTLIVNGALTISSGATLNASAQSITVTGNFTNNGTYTAGGNNVTFIGNGPQLINGSSPITFYDMIVDSALSNQDSTYLADRITLANPMASFVADGGTGQVFTLLSTASNTAAIAALPTPANFTGNITSQNFIAGETASGGLWGLWGSPVSGITVANWDGPILIGCAGCPDGNANNGYTVGYQDEAADSSFQDGFVGATTSTAIGVGQGFWVYTSDNSQTVTSNILESVTGLPNTGNISLPVTYTPQGTINADSLGWNLVANPYPSAIDLSLTGAYTLTNVDNTFYVYDPSLNGGAGDYAFYTPGVGGSNMTSILPSWQGFWVQTNAASPSIVLTENAKASTTTTPFIFKTSGTPQDSIHLILSGLGYNTDTYVRFIPGATNNFDPKYDATKLYSLSSIAPAIFSQWKGISYASNCLAPFTADISIPINVKVGTSGSYKVYVSNLNQVLPGACIVLYDTYTGTSTDLRTASYTFNASDTSKTPRFILKVLADGAIAFSNVIKNPTTTSSSDGSVICSPVGTGAWTYTWKNALDNVIRTKSNSLTADTLKNVSIGIYSVEVVTSSAMCGTAVQTFTLTSSVEATGIAENSADNNIVISNDQQGPFVQFYYDLPTDAVISAYNVIGQKVMDDVSVKAFNQKVNLDLYRVNNQVVLISVRTQEKVVNKRIFKE